ncbi:MAG: 3-ketoacyl-ACP reductase [Pseudomonadota bacterium]
MSGVVLITGGQRGIGFGIATVLRDAGFRIALAAPEPPESDEVKTALEKLGEEAHYYTFDLRDLSAVAPLLDRVEADLGPITSLVSNAGVPAPVRGDMLDLRPEKFDIVMDINLKGTFFLAQEAARRMLRAPAEVHRSLIFITSVSAEMVSPERAEYCLSKAGAAMMAQLFAVRLAGAGIGVFELRPGIIETGMTAGVKDKYDTRIAEGLVPAARWGVPKDIGDTVLPLVTGQMAFATGAVIPVDGGLSIHRL